jgi:transaldolase/glucose-6-phosphate isomerase
MDILKEIKTKGQSLWLDSLSREMLANGSLAALIKNLGVTGITSNPSIFESAILKSAVYTEPILRLAAGGASAEDIFETLAVEDIRLAADLFSDIHKRTHGTDGFVSIEVRPSLALDMEGTVREGCRLFNRIGRANAMIKVPATPEGVRAGGSLLKKGINVNFTLIFSPDRYEEVMRTYIDALTWRVEKGLPINALASVASFFVSRIDTAADSELETLLASEDAFDTEELYDFANYARGRTAIANSLAAYDKYSLVFSSKGFQALRAKGAMKQRILWASTSVKNTAYNDTMYADALLLPDSINTLPEPALRAFVAHGSPDKTPLPARTADTEVFFRKLERAGVDLRSIFEFLEKDGVEKFANAYASLISHIEGKKHATAIAAKPSAAEEELPSGDYGPALNKLQEMNFVGRLWKKDAALWKTDPAHAAIINNSLGWLDAPFKMTGRVKEIEDFRDEVLGEGFSSAVLLGMGGSSLAPEVLRSVFQSPKHLRLHVLDTTDPGWILSVTKKLDLKKTLFIFASKSGGTIEPSSQFKYFWGLLKKAGVKKPGNNFAAITDPGTGLAKLADEKKFRRIFLNFPDIGGRFSALSYFGMVPAALCGADIKKLLGRAVAMADRCKNTDISRNPGALLGTLMGASALMGRDKLTLILPEKLEVFGLWVEQLVAESTGKEGKGLVPVCMEDLSAPETYRDDRFFAHTKLGAYPEPAALAKLKASGQPIYTIPIRDAYDLGGEFFRWEAATAAAGALLAINPFDQPNVKEAKDLTLKTLESLAAGEKRPLPVPHFSSEKLSVFVSKTLNANPSCATEHGGVFQRPFSSVKEKDYIALLAYLPNTQKTEAELQKLREILRKATGAAVTLSYGPRYLHSSGQLHKGGPDTALFVILTNQAQNDINIAGEKYTFWQLEMAQAMGDFEALDSKNRRVLRIHLQQPLDKSLRYLNERISREGEKDRKGDSSRIVHPLGEESDMLKLTTKKNTGAKTKLTNTNEYVMVDHPKNLETITSRHYAIRISASDAAGLDISIDDAPWQDCRPSVGYWWYDWTNFTPGTHQLVARMRTNNGEYLISKRRRCKVC